METTPVHPFDEKSLLLWARVLFKSSGKDKELASDCCGLICPQVLCNTEFKKEWIQLSLLINWLPLQTKEYLLFSFRIYRIKLRKIVLKSKSRPKSRVTLRKNNFILYLSFFTASSGVSVNKYNQDPLCPSNLYTKLLQTAIFALTEI